MYTLKTALEIAIFWHALDMAAHTMEGSSTLSEGEKNEVKAAQDALTAAIYDKWKVWMPDRSAYQKENSCTKSTEALRSDN